MATYPSNGNVFPQPDRSRAGDARERPKLDPVLQDLHEVSDVIVAENAGADVDATSGVPAYVTSIDAQGRYLRTPITPTQSDGILDVAGASTLFAPTVHTHDAADLVSGLVDLARLGSGTPSAQTFLAGDQTWSLVQHVRLAAKNSGVATLTAGTPVYVTGAVGATIVIEVDACDAGNAATMPAIGIVEENIAPNAFGHVIPLGVIRQLDTSMYALNETLYVAVGGGLTNVRPTATTARVQNLARVMRVHATTGEILVLGAGRTNDVPNYTAARLLGRGSASGAGPAQEITVGSLLSLSGTTLSATQQDAFRAIIVAGQDTVYASGADGFELIAGTNVTLTTDQTAKTVTIDAAGGGGVTDGDKGDITVTSSGATWTIDAGVVGTSKLGGDITTAGKALLDDADNAAQRTTLGLATIASSASASDLTTGTVPTARLGTGTANSTTFLRGDQTWATPAGGSSPVQFADAPINAVAVNSTTLVDLVSKTVTVTAGDTIEIELTGTIQNNSGGTRTYTYEAELGAFGLTCVDGTTVAASATNRAQINIRAVFAVQASNNAAGTIVSQRAAPAAADVAGSIATTTYRHSWNTTTSDLTGSQAVKLRVLSSAATATQTFTVFTYRVTQHPQAL